MSAEKQPVRITYTAALQWLAVDEDDFTVREDDFAGYDYGDGFRPGDPVEVRAMLSDVEGDFHERRVRGTLIGIGPIVSDDDDEDDIDDGHVVAYVAVGGNRAIWVELEDVLGTPPKRERKIELDANVAFCAAFHRAKLFCKIAYGRDDLARQRLVDLFGDTRTWIAVQNGERRFVAPAAWVFHTIETAADHKKMWSDQQRSPNDRAKALWVRRKIAALALPATKRPRFVEPVEAVAAHLGLRLRPDYNLYYFKG